MFSFWRDVQVILKRQAWIPGDISILGYKNRVVLTFIRAAFVLGVLALTMTDDVKHKYSRCYVNSI